jgi:phage gp45-like
MYRELRERLKGVSPTSITYTSGTVVRVEGTVATVQIGDSQWEAQLRATEVDNDGQMLVVPKVGSAVVLACLSGDYRQMVVIAVDEAERIEISGEVVINGGKNGGMVNITDLTKILNNMITSYNTHTHAVAGAVTKPVEKVVQSVKNSDYEDKQVKH